MEKIITLSPRESITDILFKEPDFITEVFIEPGTGGVYAKHLFSQQPIFIGVVERYFLYLFNVKAIIVKSWKLLLDKNEVELTVILNDDIKLLKREEEN